MLVLGAYLMQIKPTMNPFTKYTQLLIISSFLSGCSNNIMKESNDKHTLLPPSCIDQTRSYMPTSHLTTITSLNAKAKTYSPVKAPKGIIEQDFNIDKQKDYIFIESLPAKHQVKARLVICISSTNNYFRKLPDFPIHVNTKPDFQSIVERIEWKNKKLLLSTFKSEHNWGSDDEIKKYRYDKKRQDFILTSQELVSSSGDGLRSDTTEFYNFDKRSYKSTNNCGNLEEGCKNTKTNGRIILPQQRASLFKTVSKPYLRKVPQL